MEAKLAFLFSLRASVEKSMFLGAIKQLVKFLPTHLFFPSFGKKVSYK